MLKFLTRFFAIIGLLMTVSIATGAYVAFQFFQKSAEEPQAPDTIVLALDFTKPVTEEAEASPFSFGAVLEDEDAPTPLFDIIRAIKRAKDDPKVKGIVATLGEEQPNIAQVQEIREALEDYKKSGKFAYAYASSYGTFGHGNKAYYLASAFNEVWLQPVGSVGLSSLAAEAPFAKEALDKIGVHADFERRAEYKSVMENVMNDSFSAPVRENMTAMLQNFEQQLTQGLAASRKITPEQATALLENGPYTANGALTAKLVDQLAYRDDLEKTAKEKAGDKAAFLSPEDYLAYPLPKAEPKATFAFIRGLGMIAENGSGLGLGGDQVMSAKEIAQAFNDAVADKDVKAIVFRVDSPGGSPSASETIRHALDKAKEAKKPVYVSMGEMAASGGYWVAMDADKIFADPATITGSIGVVVGKFVLGPLFDKLGIKWDRIETGEGGQLWSVLTPFSPKDREKINALLDETYDTFTSHVAESRKISPDKIPSIAKGRVFTGEQAKEVGLVDELGGLDDTIQALKKNLNLAEEDRVLLKSFPEPDSPTKAFLKILKGFGMQAAMGQNLFSLSDKIGAAYAPYFNAASLSKHPSALLSPEMQTLSP